jgi:hypothetical protein
MSTISNRFAVCGDLLCNSTLIFNITSTTTIIALNSSSHLLSAKDFVSLDISRPMTSHFLARVTLPTCPGFTYANLEKQSNHLRKCTDLMRGEVSSIIVISHIQLDDNQEIRIPPPVS